MSRLNYDDDERGRVRNGRGTPLRLLRRSGRPTTRPSPPLRPRRCLAIVSLPCSAPLQPRLHRSSSAAPLHSEDKADWAPLARALVARTRLPVAVPNYRLTSPQQPTQHPDHAADILQCIAFLATWPGPDTQSNGCRVRDSTELTFGRTTWRRRTWHTNRTAKAVPFPRIRSGRWTWQTHRVTWGLAVDTHVSVSVAVTIPVSVPVSLPIAVTVTVPTPQAGDAFARDAFHTSLVLGELGLHFAQIFLILAPHFSVFIFQGIEGRADDVELVDLASDCMGDGQPKKE